MSKEIFLNNLRERLKSYPSEETDKSIAYYSEMIDDRIEDGMNEEDVIASLGSVDDIANKIINELSLTTLVKCKTKEKSLPAWAIVLLVITAPVWLSLLLAAFVIIFSLYVTMWAVDVAFWAASFGIFAGSLGCLAGIFFFILHGSVLSCVAALGAAFVLAGLGILFFLGTLYLSKGIIALSKGMILGFRNMFK